MSQLDQKEIKIKRIMWSKIAKENPDDHFLSTLFKTRYFYTVTS